MTASALQTLKWSADSSATQMDVRKFQSHFCHLVYQMLLLLFICIDGLTYNFHYYGTGSGTIFLDNVVCSGNEANLFNCRYVMAQFDSHSEDVGVKCFDTTSKY